MSTHKIPGTTSTIFRLLDTSSQNWRNLAVCRCKETMLIHNSFHLNIFQKNKINKEKKAIENNIPPNSLKAQTESWMALPFAGMRNDK